MLIFRVSPHSSHMSLKLLRERRLGKVWDTRPTFEDTYDTEDGGFYVGRGRFRRYSLLF